MSFAAARKAGYDCSAGRAVQSERARREDARRQAAGKAAERGGLELDSDLDAALARFQQTDLEWGGGLANHGPMAAEALAVLGHSALIEGLVDVYAPRVPPLRVGSPIPPGERVAALGDPERLPDWVATYQLEISRRAWPRLLADELPSLLPGLFAGAAHGLLRVAHGVRAVEQRDTPVRRRELALGLAYWAGRYQELPGTPSARPLRGHGVDACFDAVPRVAPGARRPGLFFDAVRVLDACPGFARVVEAFDPGEADLSSLVHAICRRSARLYLENPGQRVAYVHCVTAPSCLRLLASHLAPGEARRALGYALQAALALHAVSAGDPGHPAAQPAPETLRLSQDEAEIRYRAACSIDEHAVKLAEACLREHAVRPDPVFRLAAADAAIHLDGGAGRGARC